jgi:hypothetical protein
MLVQEITDYKDENIQISGNQVRFGDMTYPASDIKSVAIDTEIKRPEMYNHLWFKLTQAVVLAVLVFGLLDRIFHSLPPEIKEPVSWIILLAVVINLVLIWLPSRKGEKTYKVVLKGTFGKVDAISSKNGDYAVMVADTIRSAMKYQAAQMS